MQSEKVTIGITAEGFVIQVDEEQYIIEHEFAEDGAKALKDMIGHITGDTIDVTIEEIY